MKNLSYYKSLYRLRKDLIISSPLKWFVLLLCLVIVGVCDGIKDITIVNLIVNICYGYIGGFIFYFVSDFLPSSKSQLDSLQRIIYNLYEVERLFSIIDEFYEISTFTKFELVINKIAKEDILSLEPEKRILGKVTINKSFFYSCNNIYGSLKIAIDNLLTYDVKYLSPDIYEHLNSIVNFLDLTGKVYEGEDIRIDYSRLTELLNDVRFSKISIGLYTLKMTQYKYDSSDSNTHLYKLCNKKVALLFLANFSLITGGLIYILFRPQNLLLFSLIDHIGLTRYINYMRDSLSWCEVPSFIINSLPAGLWTASYLIFMYYQTKRHIRKKRLLVALPLPLSMVILEFLQYFGWCPGTFDIYDLICYLIPLIIFIKSV